jgi:hypothetical protein
VGARHARRAPRRDGGLHPHIGRAHLLGASQPLAPPILLHSPAHSPFSRSQFQKEAFGFKFHIQIPRDKATLNIIEHKGLHDANGQRVQRAYIAYLPLVAIHPDPAEYEKGMTYYPKIIPFRARENSPIWGALAANLVDTDRKSSPTSPVAPSTD